MIASVGISSDAELHFWEGYLGWCWIEFKKKKLIDTKPKLKEASLLSMFEKLNIQWN